MYNSVGADVMGGGGTVRILERGSFCDAWEERVQGSKNRYSGQWGKVEEGGEGRCGDGMGAVMAGGRGSRPVSRRHGKPSSFVGGMGNCF
jgi:hypothetical protein